MSPLPEWLPSWLAWIWTLPAGTASLLATIVGFGGVCLTIWLGVRNVNRQLDSVQATETKRRANERDAVIRALLGELAALSTLLQGVLMRLDQLRVTAGPEGRRIAIPADLLSHPLFTAQLGMPVFDACVDRIGLLPMNSIMHLTAVRQAISWSRAFEGEVTLDEVVAQLRPLGTYVEKAKTHLEKDTGVTALVIT